MLGVANCPAVTLFKGLTLLYMRLLWPFSLASTRSRQKALDDSCTLPFLSSSSVCLNSSFYLRGHCTSERSLGLHQG